MKVLGIDTSLPVGSVSLINGNELVASKSWNSPKQHSVSVFKSLQQILGTNKNRFYEIDLAIFTAGPGSFTGIRIGLSIAKAFKASKKIKKIGTVSTLEAFSFCFLNSGLPVFVIVEGRKNRYYTYCRDKNRDIFPPEDIPEEDVIDRIKQLPGQIIITGNFDLSSSIGKFFKEKENIFVKRTFSSIAICASLYAKTFGYREEIEPIYIRRPDAKPQNKKLG